MRSAEFIVTGSMKFPCRKRKCRKTRRRRDPEAASAENDRSRMQLAADTTKCKKIKSRFSFRVIATYQSKTALQKRKMSTRCVLRVGWSLSFRRKRDFHFWQLQQVAILYLLYLFKCEIVLDYVSFIILTIIEHN